MNKFDIEFWSKEKIEAYQEIKLRKALEYAAKNSAFYQRHLDGIMVSDIVSLEDLIKLPFTSKEDLQQFNEDFLCVTKDKIVDYTTTSGTSGRPVTFALTDSDLDRLAYNEALSFDCSGIQKGDVVQLMTTMDRQFMAGLAYFLGLRELGASIIRVGAGIPELQWDAILQFKPTYLITVPSFLLKMIEFAEAKGIDMNSSGVRGAICIGEPLRNQDFSPNNISAKINEKWNIELYSTYASTEMSTAFAECEFQVGGHHHPDLLIAEIVDEDGKQVKEGESGELVITTLDVAAMPLIRFKTGDIVMAHTETCECGRNSMRLGPVIGRKHQMIKYKGTTLYPPTMYNLLIGIPNIQNHLIEIFTNELGTDEIIINLAVADPTEEFLNEIRDHFRAKLRVNPKIEFIPLEELNKRVHQAKSRKPIHFVDKRVQ